jgi:PadR family transcriptional regulator PadR
MNVQLKKGVLELCVLSMLSERERYGYELVSDISENIAISDGTIYPILRRLNSEGYLEAYLQESQGGPPRKYYRLTQVGTNTKDKLLTEWVSFVKGVNNIIKEI